MRFTTITIALAALLVSGAAGAAGGGSKDAGKGAQGPASAGEGPSAGGNAGPGDTRDVADAANTSDKAWDVGIGFEYHHLIAPGDVQGAVNRNVDYYSLSARYDFTKRDRLSFAMGVYQYFLADQNEPGVRMDDMILSYTRRVPLPGEVDIKITPSVILPTSFGSQKSHIYVVPRLGLSVVKKFGKYFDVDARIRGTAYVVGSAEGGCGFTDAGVAGFGNCDPNIGSAMPNPKGSLDLRLNAELAMPFHTPLSVGVNLYDSYSWFYKIGGGAIPGGDGGQSAFGMMAMPVLTPNGQPWNQFYGYEVDVKYEFPSLKGFKTDLSFVFAPLGDPTLGWTPVVHGDGSYAVYGYYRQTAEFYFSLNGHY